VTVTNGHTTHVHPLDGGAVYCHAGATPTIRNCVFTGNTGRQGGGAYCEGRATLIGCIFSGNVAEWEGGGLFCGDEVTVTNCTFHGNSAEAGGGLYSYGSDQAVTNCTFSGNSADYGGGLACDSSSPVLRNTIIAFSSTGESIICWGNSNPDLSCCDLFGSAGGDWSAPCIAGQAAINGNISLDPLFCDAAAGNFRLQVASPCAPFSDPNPECDRIGAWPVGGPDYADHNVGNCVLTVTDQGVLGFMDGTQAEGSGFVYPAGGSNQLFIGGLWVARDTSYVASRDYDADPDKEWTVSTVPSGYVSRNESGWISGDSFSDQDLRASYTDSAAASPRGLFVEQESYAFAAPDPADDLVILRYTIRNDGDGSLNDLYAGIFLDFDIGLSTWNTGSTDAERSLVYMSDTTGVHAGLLYLEDEPGEPALANLTLICNPTYIWPNGGYMLDVDKYDFLSAADAAHVVGNAPNPDDWSVLASAGPFDLGAAEEQSVCFAVLGGANLAELEANADAAWLIIKDGIADAPPLDPAARITRLLPGRPNPFSRSTVIQFELAEPGHVHLGIYDVGGRLVRTLARGRYAGARHTLSWDSRDDSGREVACGTYFMRMSVDGGQETWPLVRLR